MPKGTGHWLVAIMLVLLAGCSAETSAPAESAVEAPAAPLLVVAAGEAEPDSDAPGEPPENARPGMRQDTLDDEDSLAEDDASQLLQVRIQRLLDRGTRPALRRALRLLAEHREAADDESVIEPEGLVSLADAVFQGLIDWDTLALRHDSPVLAQRDLPLLRRWAGDDARVLKLAAQLQQLEQLLVLLVDADRLESEGRLVGQGKDQAVTRLREAERLSPGHAGVARRLLRIENRLIDAALAAAANGDFDQATTGLDDAGKVGVDPGRVQDAAARIVEIREQHLEQQRTRIDEALAMLDVAAAEALLPRLDELALDDRAGVKARAAIERVRLYGAWDAGALLADSLASGGLGPGMVVIPAGIFRMGSPRREKGRQASEDSQHPVRFARGFALARTEITVAQFRLFVEASKHRSTAQRKKHSMVYDERGGAMVERRGVGWQDDYVGQRAADDLPVVHVSWKDAQAYARWLAAETGLPYRLPSEAEFEYALRAGSTTAYPWGEESPPALAENLTGAGDQSPTRRSWANAFAGYADGYWGPAPVAKFQSNPFGINDMNGNVSEWVEDCWHDNYNRAPRDGSAWVNPGCKQRVIRGASWASSPVQARSAFRLGASSDTTNARVGFRVARDLQAAGKPAG